MKWTQDVLDYSAVILIAIISVILVIALYSERPVAKHQPLPQVTPSLDQDK